MWAMAVALAVVSPKPDLKNDALVGWRTCLIEAVDRYASKGQPWEIIWKGAKSACREWKIKYWLVASYDYEPLHRSQGLPKAARDVSLMEELLEGDMARELLNRR